MREEDNTVFGPHMSPDEQSLQDSGTRFSHYFNIPKRKSYRFYV